MNETSKDSYDLDAAGHMFSENMRSEIAGYFQRSNFCFVFKDFSDNTELEEYLRKSNSVGRPKGSKNASFLYFTDYHTRKNENQEKSKNSPLYEQDSSSDSEGEEFYHPFEPVYKFNSRRSVATRLIL